ncbi:MAG: isochorismatase family cysteine hydrolase [Pseudomonadota bacterium]|nr:isochorismatase family cysteine hydrolase [Pseudomonadota bacterium]
MHKVTVRQEIIDRVLVRRGRHHLFKALNPVETAFVIIDMQNMFCEHDAPAEVPVAREICGSINGLCRELRAMGGLIIWITSATTSANGKSDWEQFIRNFVAEEMQERTVEALQPGGHGEQIWHALDIEVGDLLVRKNRYSALTPGSSILQSILSSHGIRNVLIGGTKTNICCESTGRDAMMLDFNVVMVEDCNAALSDEEHRSALENVIQQFGDVMTAKEVVALLNNRRN